MFRWQKQLFEWKDTQKESGTIHEAERNGYLLIVLDFTNNDGPAGAKLYPWAVIDLRHGVTVASGAKNDLAHAKGAAMSVVLAALNGIPNIHLNSTTEEQHAG